MCVCWSYTGPRNDRCRRRTIGVCFLNGPTGSPPQRFFFYMHTQHTCRTINSLFIVYPPPTFSSVRVPRIPVGPAEYDVFNGSPGGESWSTRIRCKHRAKLTVIKRFSNDLALTSSYLSSERKTEVSGHLVRTGSDVEEKQPEYRVEFDGFYRYKYRQIKPQQYGVEPSSPPYSSQEVPGNVRVALLSFTAVGKILSMGLQLLRRNVRGARA